MEDLNQIVQHVLVAALILIIIQFKKLVLLHVHLDFIYLVQIVLL
jgi:hypothetical protein